LSKNLLYFLILISTSCFGQELTGYIYDTESRLPNVRIENISQSKAEVSNQNGYFRIDAVVGDTIHFSSVAYEFYELVIEHKQLEGSIVVELKTSTLEEVKLTAYKSRNSDVQNLDKQLMYQIRQDAKKRPELYEPSSGNIAYILSTILKLFKSDKPKKKTSHYRLLEFEDFESLFLRDSDLNTTFLLEELHISKHKHELFFDFLDSKKLNASLLEPENKLELIDKLYSLANDYRALVSSTKIQD
jgi:hypothetical protein